MVGVICPSNRPEYWKDLYDNLSHNKAEFNLTIVGPKEPLHDLPKNFKYIKSNVKPAQCSFIAMNNVDGEYLLPIADDISFDPGLLDCMVEMLSENNKHTSITPGLYYDGTYVVQDNMYIDVVDYDNPDIDKGIVFFPVCIPYCQLMYKDSVMEIGIDQHFVTCYWPTDISLELASRGGQIVHCGKSVYEKYAGCRLHDTYKKDLDFLLQMWLRDRNIYSGHAGEINGKRYRMYRIGICRYYNIVPLEYLPDVLYHSQGITDGTKWD